MLLRQAALVVALSTRVGQLGPAEVRSALRDLFEEEEGYWRRTAGEVIAPGQPTPALRAALAASAVVGTDGLADAATVLRRVPALAVGAADRLARLAVWWHGLYARAGDAAAPTPRLPAWLADRLPDGTDNTGISWTVAALDAERRATIDPGQADPGRAPGRLAAGARTAHDGESSRAAAEDAAAAHASLRRAVNAAAPVDEALAWLTQELELDRGRAGGARRGDLLPDPVAVPDRDRAGPSAARRCRHRRRPGRVPAQPRRPLLRAGPVGRGSTAHRARRARRCGSSPTTTATGTCPTWPRRCPISPPAWPNSASANRR